MTIELPTSIEEQLRNLAVKQGKGVAAVLEAAIRKYLTDASITVLDPADVAEAQVELIGELYLVSALEP